MISIILPFYNASKYLRESIDSSLAALPQGDELLIINDGSTDSSKEIALSFQDPRIRYFEQENKGVAAARNVGLANMRGDYFCFLDADDIFPPHSLSARLQKFKENPYLDFADGEVLLYDHSLSRINSKWSPSYKGNPFADLVQLKGGTFLGVTWLIKRRPEINYRFKEGFTHGEDLLFFMELSRSGGQYDYVNEPILHYRDTPGSAMKNLKGLEMGYRTIEQCIQKWPEVKMFDMLNYRLRWRKFMALDYLKRRDWISLLRLIK